MQHFVSRHALHALIKNDINYYKLSLRLFDSFNAVSDGSESLDLPLGLHKARSDGFHIYVLFSIIKRNFTLDRAGKTASPRYSGNRAIHLSLLTMNCVKNRPYGYLFNRQIKCWTQRALKLYNRSCLLRGRRRVRRSHFRQRPSAFFSCLQFDISDRR